MIIRFRHQFELPAAEAALARFATAAGPVEFDSPAHIVTATGS